MTACNPFTESDQLQVDGAEGSRTVLCSDGVIHHAAGHILELLVFHRLRFVGLFTHMVGCFGSGDGGLVAVKMVGLSRRPRKYGVCF